MFALLSFPALWVTITSFIFLGATVALRLDTNTTALWWAKHRLSYFLVVFTLHALGAWHSDHQHCCKVFRAMSRRGVLQQVRADFLWSGYWDIYQTCEQMSKSTQVLKQAKSDHIFGILPQRKVTTTTFGKNRGTSWLLCLINKFKRKCFHNWDKEHLLSSKNFSSSLFGDGKGHPSNMTTYLSNPQQNPAASVSEVVDPQTGTIVYWAVWKPTPSSPPPIWWASSHNRAFHYMCIQIGIFIIVLFIIMLTNHREVPCAFHRQCYHYSPPHIFVTIVPNQT